jgi:hypothetical protein
MLHPCTLTGGSVESVRQDDDEQSEGLALARPEVTPWLSGRASAG